jgi:NAD-dependent deacetylase
MSEQSTLEQFARLLSNAQHLVVFSGAGISKESGIPTFRDAHDGLWARYDATQLATPGAFLRNPKLVWDWYEYRRGLVAQANPNAGHYALIELEALLPQVIVVTQNIDGFHEMVGNTDVICLHGNIQLNRCFSNCQGDPTYVDVNQLEYDHEAGPPRCPYCQKAYVRPAVVWFEEALPAAALERAFQVSAEADVMLVIGTSGAVYPAAHLPFITHQNGGTILEINPNPSSISSIARCRLVGPSGELLPCVVKIIHSLKRV